METQYEKNAVFVAPGDGTRLSAVGGRLRLKLGGAQTGNSLCLFEAVVPPGSGTPPHVHSCEDEIFYVLEGVLDVQLGDKDYQAEPGTLAYLPRGIVHRFHNSTDQPTTFLALSTSPATEDFFENLSRLTQQPGFQFPDVLPLADRFGIEMRPERVRAALGPNRFGQTGLVSEPGQGRETGYQGGQVTVKLASANTGGLLSGGEGIVPPGGGPPAHFHKGFEEIFFVLEGDFVFRVGLEVYSATPGAVLYLPRGLSHEFRNIGDQPGRLLTFLTPGGFEEWFFRVGGLEAAGQLTPEALISLGQEMDAHFPTDPPLAESLTPKEKSMSFTTPNTHGAATPERLFQMAFGFAPTLILEAAIRYRLFDVLEEEAKTVAEVSKATTASPRGLRFLMDALTALDFLSKCDQDRYALTPESAAFLVSTRPSYQGGFFRQMVRHRMPSWMDLAEVVHSGVPITAVNQEKDGTAFFAEFAEDLFPMNYLPAKALAAALELSASQSPVPVLDVGCGSGVWGIALAQQSPCVQVTAVDWPGVVPVAERMAARFGLSEQFEFRGGDFLEVPFGEGYMVATLGQVLHGEGEESSQALLKKVFASLAPGGTIVIAEMLSNEERTGPPHALIFAMNMLLHTENGDVFSFGQIQQWLIEAGFVEERMLPVPGPSPLILARKP